MSTSASALPVTATFTVPVTYTNDPTGYFSSLGIHQGMPMVLSLNYDTGTPYDPLYHEDTPDLKADLYYATGGHLSIGNAFSIDLGSMLFVLYDEVNRPDVRHHIQINDNGELVNIGGQSQNVLLGAALLLSDPYSYLHGSALPNNDDWSHVFAWDGSLTVVFAGH